MRRNRETSISVVIPVYNTEKYIDRCINSVINQSFNRFEIILIDDGGNDTSAEICDYYVYLDNRSFVIHQKNQGVSNSRNHGVVFSHGNYITFLDSDDYIEHLFLSKLYNSCINNSAQIAFCDYVIDSENERKEIRCASNNLLLSNVKAIQLYAESNLKNNNALFRSPWAKLIQRDIVAQNLFPLDREYAEDASCVFRWIWASRRITHMNYCGYYYYQNIDGICQRPVGDYYIGNFISEEEWISFFKKNGFMNLYKLTCRRYILDAFLAYKKSEKQMFMKILRKGLFRFRRRADISIKEYGYYYETAFPKAIRLYWYNQSIIKKLKRK